MIVCIGDSITAGQYLAEGEKAWPALIQLNEVKAAGVSDDTTRLGLERFPRDVQKLAPFVVVIQFGHNDANRWLTDHGLPRVSEWAYRANLTEMVDRCRAFGAQPFLCTLIPSHKNLRHSQDVQHYDQALREVAADTQTRLIDVRAVWDSLELLMSDGVHPSAEGHKRYAQTVQRAIDTWRRGG
jgi:lysophospholipase L1-like esterase